MRALVLLLLLAGCASPPGKVMRPSCVEPLPCIDCGVHAVDAQPGGKQQAELLFDTPTLCAQLGYRST